MQFTFQEASHGNKSKVAFWLLQVKTEGWINLFFIIVFCCRMFFTARDGAVRKENGVAKGQNPLGSWNVCWKKMVFLSGICCSADERLFFPKNCSGRLSLTIFWSSGPFSSIHQCCYCCFIQKVTKVSFIRLPITVVENDFQCVSYRFCSVIVVPVEKSWGASL